MDYKILWRGLDTPLKLRDGPLDIVKVVDEGSGYTTEAKGWTIRYCGGVGEGSGYTSEAKGWTIRYCGGVDEEWIHH